MRRFVIRPMVSALTGSVYAYIAKEMGGVKRIYHRNPKKLKNVVRTLFGENVEFVHSSAPF